MEKLRIRPELQIDYTEIYKIMDGVTGRDVQKLMGTARLAQLHVTEATFKVKKGKIRLKQFKAVCPTRMQILLNDAYPD